VKRAGVSVILLTLNQLYISQQFYCSSNLLKGLFSNKLSNTANHYFNRPKITLLCI